MENQSSRLEYKVGIFLAMGLLAVMVSIVLLGGGQSFFARYFQIKARFTEVQGLFPGSVVSLAGIPVGNVTAIAFVPSENRLEVTMKINDVYKQRLVEGTVAEVRTQGALGDKFVYLIPGPPDARALANGEVIETIETDLLRMLTSREDGVARVIDLIKEVHLLIATINANGQTTTMMRNVSDAAEKMKSTLSQLDALLGDLRSEIPENKKLKQAVISLSNVMEKIDQGKGTLGQLINDPSLHQNLKSILGGSPRNRYMKDMIRETIQQNDPSR
jgi:phospholipid/cholesterol/gamma-HCH transport system substrate-binding protein